MSWDRLTNETLRKTFKLNSIYILLWREHVLSDPEGLRHLIIFDGGTITSPLEHSGPIAAMYSQVNGCVVPRPLVKNRALAQDAGHVDCHRRKGVAGSNRRGLFWWLSFLFDSYVMATATCCALGLE